MDTHNATEPTEPTGLLWTDLTPQDFGENPKPVQGALFAAPDPCGTLDIFDSE